jgi:hypothetical protein
MLSLFKKKIFAFSSKVDGVMHAVAMMGMLPVLGAANPYAVE